MDPQRPHKIVITAHDVDGAQPHHRHSGSDETSVTNPPALPAAAPWITYAGWLCAAVLVIVLAIVALRSSGDRTAAVDASTTQRYWQELVDAVAAAQLPDMRVEVEPYVVVAALRDHATRCQVACDAIQSLGTQRVDAAAAQWAAAWIGQLEAEASLATDYAGFVQRGADFAAWSTSGEALLYAFLRGYAGDPFGPALEQSALSRELREEFRQLDGRVRVLHEGKKRLLANGQHLKSELQVKFRQYFRDLPDAMNRSGSDTEI
ncbi:MAG: hypothetical protein WD851_08955 [Pirellulales bacterium]